MNGWAGDRGSKFYTDGQSVFECQLRDTQYAYFGLSFFKGGSVERAVHSAGGPPPGNGPNQIQCRHLPSSLSSHQLDAVKSISGPQLKLSRPWANGTSTTGILSNIVEDDVVQPGESSSSGTGGS